MLREPAETTVLREPAATAVLREPGETAGGVPSIGAIGALLTRF